MWAVLTEPEIDLELYAKDKSKWLRGTKIECPTNLYVCYSKKVEDIKKVKYIGCKRVNKSCQSLGLEHFGHYLSNFEATKALKRCQESKPKN